MAPVGRATAEEEGPRPEVECVKGGAAERQLVSADKRAKVRRRHAKGAWVWWVVVRVGGVRKAPPDRGFGAMGCVVRNCN